MKTMLFILLLNQLAHGAPTQNQDLSLSITLGDESNTRLDNPAAIMGMEDVWSHAKILSHSHLEEKQGNDVLELPSVVRSITVPLSHS